MSSKGRTWLNVGIRSVKGKISLTFLFFLLAPPVFAAGGTCPAGANYLNWTTGSLVTLSSLGVTNCYFIAASGADTNTGTDEAHPWLHAPQMPNCSNNCATVQNATLPAGTGLIFRGGDTWHISDNSASPYVGGTWGFNLGAAPSGTLSNPIYVGVDPGWFTGGSWVRPILTGDNPTSTATNLGPCAYQAGSANILVNFSGSSHFIVDNFEFLGLCQESVGSPSGWDQYISYGSSSDMQFLNLYLHGWTHEQFGDPGDPADCGPGGSYICFNTWVFKGGGSTTPDDVFRYDVIDGSDSDPEAAGTCYCDFWDVAYNYIGNQADVITRYQHLYHDNLYEYWYENGHGNVMESVGDAPGTNAVYNSVFRHINVPNAAGDPFFWPYPSPGTTDYYFNLLVYDVGAMEMFNVGQNYPETNGQGPLVVFNNTIQSNSNSGNGGIFSCVSPYPYLLTLANNHYIIDTTAYNAACVTAPNSDTTSRLMTNATATTDGYNSSELYAYSPPFSNSPTVGAGTNENTNFCGALTTAGLTGAATACQSDTTYACSYDSSNHTVSCPARTTNVRPGSGNWDIGAYEYGDPPNPPSNLTAVVQ